MIVIDWKGSPSKLYLQWEKFYGKGLLFRWIRRAVQCAMVSREKFYDMTYTFVTTQTTLSAILSVGLVAGLLPSVSSAQTKFGGHKYKRECDMNKAVTRCLITEDMD
jgi:hypothetical protein